MRNTITIISVVLLLNALLNAQIISIADARIDANHDFIPDKLNDTVTVTGVVFTPNFQTVNRSYFIWDGTAGICTYKTKLTSPQLNLGDSILITGQIQQIEGLTRIIPLTDNSITVISTNAGLPEPVRINPGEFYANTEKYESSLVRVIRLRKLNGIWPLSSGNATLDLTNDYDSVVLRIDSDTDLDDGKLEPLWPKDIIGVITQFATSIANNDGYQLMPRYYAKDFAPATPLAVNDKKISADDFNLEQNYPNPFNPSTTIEYTLGGKSKVKIVIFNALGQLKENLFTGDQPEGTHFIKWTTNLPSGIYFYHMEITPENNNSKPFTKTRKMILLK